MKLDVDLVNIKLNIPQVGSKRYVYSIIDDKFKIDDELYNKNIDYIIDINGELLLGSGHFKLNNKKKSLIMAGELIINKNGKVSYINNNSGHYQPSLKQFSNFIFNLNYLTTDLFSNDVIIEKINW